MIIKIYCGRDCVYYDVFFEYLENFDCLYVIDDQLLFFGFEMICQYGDVKQVK